MILRGSHRTHQCLSKVMLEESDLVKPQNDLKEIVADGEVRFLLNLMQFIDNSDKGDRCNHQSWSRGRL